MSTAFRRTFRSGNSEAVSLPKDVAFGPDVEVTIVRSGDVLTIFPRCAPIIGRIERLSALPAPRDVELRDTEALPERPGL